MRREKGEEKKEKKKKKEIVGRRRFARHIVTLRSTMARNEGNERNERKRNETGTDERKTGWVEETNRTQGKRVWRGNSRWGDVGLSRRDGSRISREIRTTTRPIVALERSDHSG
jgi:hypothetical protein